MDNRPIGVFDSGVGGLTVVSELMNVIGNERIIYFGDTARVPYGNKSKDIVTKFSMQDVRFLLTKDVKAIVVACNTVSSNSLVDLKNKFDVPIFGVVIPGANEAVKTTKNKKVGVIGTVATIRSNVYEEYIVAKDKEIKVYSKACPMFVPLAEEDWTDNEIAYLTAKEYLTELVNFGIDSLVMGCTHYPLLRNCIKKVVGNGINLVDPAHETALVLKKFLEDNNMFRAEKSIPSHEFYLSDPTDMFKRICNKALSREFSAEQVDIEKF